jgi:protein-L-isoaspartate(D-aspartate) O-methyltransferase
VSAPEAWRRFYADEIRVVASLRSTALVDALAAVPRERFLDPGPWTVRGEADVQTAPRRTRDADPREVHHNVAVAIDAGRQLFNGAPGVVAAAIDALQVAPGRHVLHVGTGLGYYTAIIGHCVGSAGRVTGIEIDPQLADRARANLSDLPQVAVHRGDGRSVPDGPFDGILISAGVTHPPAAWLDALAPGGRLVVPLTASIGSMGPISKGLLILISRDSAGAGWTARVLTFVAIYSAVNLRDDAVNATLGKALSKNPFPRLGPVRRDAHTTSEACWLHTEECCIGLGV